MPSPLMVGVTAMTSCAKPCPGAPLQVRKKGARMRVDGSLMGIAL